MLSGAGGQNCDQCVVRLTISGKPFAKQRPRFSRASGRAYTPKETVSFERTVATIAAAKIAKPIAGPVMVHITATFEPAQSWSAKKRAALINGPHIQRPDLDNIIKAVKDGLNRIAWADDAQVWRVSAEKTWGPVAQTVVTISKGDQFEYDDQSDRPPAGSRD
jgi:Holliday junction resolvase RusA-like endonuclease